MNKITTDITLAMCLAVIDTLRTMGVKREEEKRWLDLIQMNYKKHLKGIENDKT